MSQYQEEANNNRPTHLKTGKRPPKNSTSSTATTSGSVTTTTETTMSICYETALKPSTMPEPAAIFIP